MGGFSQGFSSGSGGGGGNIPGQLKRTGILSVSLDPGQTDNFDNAQLSSVSILRITPGAGGSSLSGIVAQDNGAILLLYNLGSDDLTILDESGDSDASNRFAFPGDFILPAEVGAQIWYDGISDRWRLLSA